MAKALLLITWLAMLAANTAAADPHKVKELIKVEGQPFQVVFEDGKIIGLKAKTTFTPLHTSLTLTENSCTRMVGTKGDFIIPLVLRSLIPYWIAHPSKQGQPVLKYDSESKKDEVNSSTALITRLADAQFDQTLMSVPANGVEDKEIYNLAKKSTDAFGWFKCPGDCQGLLPQNTEVLFWDENFETENNQTRMTRDQSQPSFNQMTSRLQQLPLTTEGNRIKFGQPARTFGLFALFLPPGITYQVQWTFRDKNLIEPDDDLCQMKWDLDFTRIFTQFTQATESVQDVNKVRHEPYPVYNYSAKDEQFLYFSSTFSESTWSATEVRK